ncbi:hypothetical protein HZS_7514 [Henneguya salminicola]|nr:hypothetical protein HZS_7514 [Henneguya salminicola]
MKGGCKARIYTSKITNQVKKCMNWHKQGSNLAGAEITRIKTIIQTANLETRETRSQMLDLNGV